MEGLKTYGKEWKEKGREELVRKKEREKKDGERDEVSKRNGEKLIQTCKEKMDTMGGKGREKAEESERDGKSDQ